MLEKKRSFWENFYWERNSFKEKDSENEGFKEGLRGCSGGLGRRRSGKEGGDMRKSMK